MRQINEIANDIYNNWPKPYFAAEPYLAAMCNLNTINDYYLQDSAREIILRFLANASSFRGEAAKKLKAELKELL